MEVKILFPKINSISIANHYYNEQTDSVKVIPVVLYNSKSELSKDDSQKLKTWLEKRLDIKNISLFRK